MNRANPSLIRAMLFAQERAERMNSPTIETSLLLYCMARDYQIANELNSVGLEADLIAARMKTRIPDEGIHAQVTESKWSKLKAHFPSKSIPYEPPIRMALESAWKNANEKSEPAPSCLHFIACMLRHDPSNIIGDLSQSLGLEASAILDCLEA